MHFLEVPSRVIEPLFAERVQPQLMQFKTNHGNQEIINRQADILAETIQWFD